MLNIINRQNVRWLIYNTKPHIVSLVVLTMFDTITALTGVFSTIIVKKVIDCASLHLEVRKLLLTFILITLFGMIVDAIFSVISVSVCEKYSFTLRQNLFDGILRSTMSEINRYHSGKLMTRLTSDINIVAGGITQIFTSFFVLAIKLAAAFATLYYFDSGMAVMVLCLAPVNVIIGYFIGKKIKVLQEKVVQSEENYRGFMQEAVSNLSVIKAFSNENIFSEKLDVLRHERLKWIVKKNNVNVVASFLMNGFYNFVYIIVFVIGIIRLRGSIISYGTFALFITIVNQIQDPVIGLSKLLPQGVAVWASIGRIVEIESITKERDGEMISLGDKVDVAVDNVYFGYNEKEVLKDTTFSIKSGEFAAVLGKSGVGKTTLVKTLLGFVQPNKGNVWYAGSNGKCKTVCKQIRGCISYVPQGNTLFSGKISDNVRIGNDKATDEEIISALKCACADDFLDSLDDGNEWDICLGEKGLGLSEGQAQRIAIARAIVKKAPFLILDEATSALDEKTEQRVLDNISRLNPRPACMVITHRKAALKFCNKIIKINPGSTV